MSSKKQKGSGGRRLFDVVLGEVLGTNSGS